MAAILAVAGLTLLASFICSLFEAALLTLTASQVDVAVKKGRFGAQRLAKLRKNIDQPIAAILTLNTSSHTIGAAWCGALVGAYYGSYWAGVFAAVFTLAMLFLTEIIPKTLGVAYADLLGPWIAWPIQFMVWISFPVVLLTSGMMRRVTARHVGAPTEEEIIAGTRLAAQVGELRPQELRWVENALRLDHVKAYDLMTPRTVVYRLPADLPLSAIKERSAHWVHSRLPLVEDNDPDKVIGMVLRRDVFDALVQENGHARTLRDLMQPIEFVPETMRGHQLLDQFITRKKHMFGVVDEYGAFMGVVTLEDVLECLLGSEIMDEYDTHADMQQYARRKARRLARLMEAPVVAEAPSANAGGES